MLIYLRPRQPDTINTNNPRPIKVTYGHMQSGYTTETDVRKAMSQLGFATDVSVSPIPVSLKVSSFQVGNKRKLFILPLI